MLYHFLSRASITMSGTRRTQLPAPENLDYLILDILNRQRKETKARKCRESIQAFEINRIRIAA